MSKKKERTKLKWLKMVRRTLESIQMTKKSDPEAFYRLKKKAEKYLAKAKELENK